MDIGIWEGRQRRIVSADQRMIGRQQLRIGKNQEVVVTKRRDDKREEEKKKRKIKREIVCRSENVLDQGGSPFKPQGETPGVGGDKFSRSGLAIRSQSRSTLLVLPRGGCVSKKSEISVERGGNKFSSLLLAIFAGGGEDGKNKAGQLFFVFSRCG